MKFSKLSQLFLVSSIGLLVATFLTACQIVTVDYVFVAYNSNSDNTSGIETYAVDSESGAMRTVGSNVSLGKDAAVALAATSDYQHLYVANKANNTVVHFTIGLHGELTQKDVVNTSGAPVSIAVNAAGTYLYVVSSPATLTAYSLSSGTIGAEADAKPLSLSGYGSDTLVPTGVTTLANNGAVYVTAFDQSAYNPGVANCGQPTSCSTANPGWVFGFSIGSGGTLVPSTNSPYKAGVKPSGLVADPTNRFVYVSDYASNQLIGYSIQSGSTLSFLLNGPFKTGNEPSSVAIDPRGKYLYVANSLDSSVSAYAIDVSTGTPSAAISSTGSATNSTDTDPVSIVVDPALGRFVMTANNLGNSVSGFRLDTSSGALTTTQVSPYPLKYGSGPTALVAVPHGNHALQSVAP
jgi:YVTN family beta-propeller protein